MLLSRECVAYIVKIRLHEAYDLDVKYYQCYGKKANYTPPTSTLGTRINGALSIIFFKGKKIEHFVNIYQSELCLRFITCVDWKNNNTNRYQKTEKT